MSAHTILSYSVGLRSAWDIWGSASPSKNQNHLTKTNKQTETTHSSLTYTYKTLQYRHVILLININWQILSHPAPFITPPDCHPLEISSLLILETFEHSHPQTLSQMLIHSRTLLCNRGRLALSYITGASQRIHSCSTKQHLEVSWRETQEHPSDMAILGKCRSHPEGGVQEKLQAQMGGNRRLGRAQPCTWGQEKNLTSMLCATESPWHQQSLWWHHHPSSLPNTLSLQRLVLQHIDA